MPTLTIGALREAAAPEVVVTKEIVGDRAAHALIGASEDAALLVIGSRRVGALASFFVGSVSTAVSLRAACPVIVVRGPEGLAGERRGVVVGVDGREGSQSALAFAFDHASRSSAPLHAILCWHPDLLAEMMWRAEPPAPSHAEAILSETLAGWA